MISNAKTEIGREIEDLKDSLRAAHKLIEKYGKEVQELEAAAEKGDAVFQTNTAESGNGDSVEAGSNQATAKE